MNLNRSSSALAAMFLVVLFATAVCAQSATEPYSIVKMAEGVYGFVWDDQTGPEPNMLIVVNDDDVLLVDSSMYPSSARAVVSEIRKLTPKPVRYLVNTHWHDDHLFGNSVIQEAWPDVRIVTHANTRIDATSKAFGSTPKVLEDRIALIGKYRTMLETNTGPFLQQQLQRPGGCRPRGRAHVARRRLRAVSVPGAHDRYRGWPGNRRQGFASVSGNRHSLRRRPAVT